MTIYYTPDEAADVVGILGEFDDVLAENERYKMTLYDDGDDAYVEVVDFDKIPVEVIHLDRNPTRTIILIEKLYDEYDMRDDGDDLNNDEITQIIADREFELSVAVDDMLAVFRDGSCGEQDIDDAEIITRVTNIVGIFLHNHGIEMYRPDFVKDKDGVFYTECPYECIEDSTPTEK